MKAPAKSSGSSSPAVSTLGVSPGREPRATRSFELFSLLAEHDHEQVSFAYEPSCGYRGIIAIHSTVLGPALGGTRFWNYRSDEEALVDCLRLARGMTYKAAVAGLNLGGGKSVIIGDNRTPRREALFRAHGRHVESLKGRYITAEDVGTSTSDMEYIKAETNHVTGLIGRSGDPSPVTAYGVYRGLKACARYRDGSESLAGKSIALQGCGSVGYHLAKLVFAEGADITCTDIDPQRVKRVVEECGATAVEPDAIYDVRANIFAPCALGAVINDDTVQRLQVEIVAGAANNQLAEDRHGDELAARHHLRPRLRDQWRRADQRERRAARLGARARPLEGGGDLRHPAARVRDRARGRRSHIPSGGPVGGAADCRDRQSAAELCLRGSMWARTTRASS